MEMEIKNGTVFDGIIKIDFFLPMAPHRNCKEVSFFHFFIFSFLIYMFKTNK
jgi:hypothetical protein